MVNFRDEVNQNLSGIVTDLKATADRVEEAEQRVAKLKESNSELRGTLSDFTDSRKFTRQAYRPRGTFSKK